MVTTFIQSFGFGYLNLSFEKYLFVITDATSDIHEALPAIETIKLAPTPVTDRKVPTANPVTPVRIS